MSRAKTGYEPHKPSDRRADVLWQVNDEPGLSCERIAYGLNYGVGITQADLLWLMRHGYVRRYRQAERFQYEPTASGIQMAEEQSS